MHKKMIDSNPKQAELDYLNVSDEEVRELIKDFISDRDIFYPSDIAYELNLDYDQVCSVLDLLKNEGVIGDIE